MSSSGLLNTNNVCSECGGRVKNATGKRCTRERLAELHADICPGITRRGRKGNSDDDQG